MAAEKQSATASAVVAAGHTVQVENGKSYGPGESVEMSAFDIESLSLLGFLVVPGAVAIPVSPGPSFGPSEGPTVRVA